MSSSCGLTRVLPIAFLAGVALFPFSTAAAAAAAAPGASRQAAAGVSLQGDSQRGLRQGDGAGHRQVVFTSSTITGAPDPALSIDLPGLASGTVQLVDRTPYVSGTVYLLGQPVALHGVPGRDLGWWVETAAKAPAGR